jgi:hypothetical protein
VYGSRRRRGLVLVGCCNAIVGRCTKDLKKGQRSTKRVHKNQIGVPRRYKRDKRRLKEDLKES